MEEPYRVPYFPVMPTFFVRLPMVAVLLYFESEKGLSYDLVGGDVGVLLVWGAWRAFCGDPRLREWRPALQRPPISVWADRGGVPTPTLPKSVIGVLVAAGQKG